jgi:hypothetical protein
VEAAPPEGIKGTGFLRKFAAAGPLVEVDPASGAETLAGLITQIDRGLSQEESLIKHGIQFNRTPFIGRKILVLRNANLHFRTGPSPQGSLCSRYIMVMQGQLLVADILTTATGTGGMNGAVEAPHTLDLPVDMVGRQTEMQAVSLSNLIAQGAIKDMAQPAIVHGVCSNRHPFIRDFIDIEFHGN